MNNEREKFFKAVWINKKIRENVKNFVIFFVLFVCKHKQENWFVYYNVKIYWTDSIEYKKTENTYHRASQIVFEKLVQNL